MSPSEAPQPQDLLVVRARCCLWDTDTASALPLHSWVLPVLASPPFPPVALALPPVAWVALFDGRLVALAGARGRVEGLGASCNRSGGGVRGTAAARLVGLLDHRAIAGASASPPVALALPPLPPVASPLVAVVSPPLASASPPPSRRRSRCRSRSGCCRCRRRRPYRPWPGVAAGRRGAALVNGRVVGLGWRPTVSSGLGNRSPRDRSAPGRSTRWSASRPTPFPAAGVAAGGVGVAAVAAGRVAAGRRGVAALAEPP